MPPRLVARQCCSSSERQSCQALSLPSDGRQWITTGNLAGPRTLQLFKKNSLLNVARRVVVEIIETDFSPGNHLGRSCELTEFLEIRIGRQLRFVRMNTDGGVNEFVLLS